MADLGFLGIIIPEEYGGAGLDHLTVCLVMEELAAADAGFSTGFAVQNGLGPEPLLNYGTEQQKSGPAGHRLGRALLFVRLDRARRRLGRRRTQDPWGRTAGRFVHDQRQQDVDHRRGLREPVHHLRPYRGPGCPRHHRIHR